MKPTPGSWMIRKALHEVDGAHDYAICADLKDRQFCIAEAYGRADEDLWLPAEANARLIAAACNAIQSAAEALGCDPLELAESLQDGGLATEHQALERAADVIDELCYAIDRAENDIGGRSVASCLKDLGPCAEQARAALAKFPERK